MASSAGESPKCWSEPVTLKEAAGHVPVLVRLEEGYRGMTEDKSISQNDIMALQSCTNVQGRKVVLAHYMREGDMTGTAIVEGEIYRALFMLPLDNYELSELLVVMMVDPTGSAYQNWVTTNFPTDNWKKREAEALKAMATNRDADILVYANLGPVKQPLKPPSFKKASPGGLGKNPPPPPPKSSGLSSDLSGMEGGKPPPRPPKPKDIAKSLTLPAMSAATPYLPPRRTRSDATDDDVYEVHAEDQEIATWGLGLGLASLSDPSSHSLPAYIIDDRPPALLPPTAAEKKKPKEGHSGGMLKKITEKIYYKFTGAPKSPQAQHDASGTEKEYYSEPKVPPFKAPLPTPADDHDDDDDSDGDYVDVEDSDEDNEYTEINEDMMIEFEAKRKSRELKHAKEKSKKNKKGATPIQMYGGKPTLQVSPVRAESSLPTPPLHQMMSPIYNQGKGKTFPPMDTMSVKELCQCLRDCSMSAFAKTCEVEKLDGRFLMSLSDDSLRKPPFSLSEWEITKLKRVKLGWVPT